MTAPFAAIGDPSAIAIFFFCLFILVALVISYWAARRTKTTEQFYAAGHQVSGFQNGMALAGDYMSAASFLGIAGLVALYGFDGLIYSIGFLVGWPIVLFLIAEPLRNLGKYTFADVVAYRLKQTPVRMAAAVGTLSVVIFYLIAQMVGAGVLITLMFDIDYAMAVAIVGTVMLVLILFGGMIATTWVQIVKATLLLGGALALALWVLSYFSWNPLELFDSAATDNGEEVLAPGDAVVTGSWDAVSLGLALMFGTAGLPHILMRFYTVPDAKAARTSVNWATFFIGGFYLLTFVLGFGAMALVGQGTITGVDEGGNMAAPLLAQEVGGEPFLGFIAAVAFATILAVVAGLALSGAAALSHDLWVNVVRHGEAPEREQLRVAKIATVIMGATAIVARDRPRGAERRIHGRPRVCDCRERELPGAPDGHLLAPLHDVGRRGEHPRRRGVRARADLPLADDPGGRARQRLVALPAEEPGPHLDAARVRDRHRRLAPDA